ncbi:bifunctional aldehyde dehydrogenase/enoyl-CoA hydratase [Mycobacterium avium]|uniref:Bifunctional aldehyde dehydrogenase/enoyl-CoA hydratase n=1 Tax=Mycobacterium avium TaxID=1764 RepID=A0A2A2ZNI8_MYCAV|nr:phenylacetic acid degradation bifunctional protein PaaZ [Mycobacterium avium]ETZ44704.1 phenylacetic acid degradation protein paaN [Mycobacterium avium MAV_120709_2344]MCA4735816.1 phenylacetic acid degradation bifunctional protein PaaZ [Mycobacterium avium subsp. hominissuis]MCA4740465.1 phenylacetic acid degradation bifunctional protein PaaZ [Mycobacterium avium subsp. hominissuis]MCA4744703.1 phenylacetic acid degradation bifunctional protein PaaZ [Mycobacterium avium subsp. hominissuis]
MTSVVESYVTGKWVSPEGDTVALLNAVTGDEVARFASGALDLAAVIAHGRDVGGPALRALTFHQRASALKALGKLLMSRKDDFYPVSAATGATPRDSAVDVDGGFGTLFSYASKGVRELPNDTIYLDGSTEILGRAGTFVGQHLYTSRLGVAVQINAFNFPVWGMLEKLAPAFLAGVPSIVKPAHQTAYLTEAVFRVIVESGLLPEGSIQLLCASPRALLDHLDSQDTVLFTGSASTAAKLRSHPNVVEAGVRFNAEADSLNCSILGPDATADTPEFDLYVKQLVTEMTTKAGQKCTAIRRALVPVELIDQVVEATRARLSTIVIGNPDAEGVRMGALASLNQREEVLRSLKSLRDAATLVFGDPDSFTVEGADSTRGAFLPPLLLRAQDPYAPALHEVEAFGPVSTVIGYRDLDDAIALAARGKGSLVGSLVTHDPAVARHVTIGIAPYHGRVLVLDRDDAKESTGHGSPLPTLVHGGPGRAGGGEELGGIRGVLHFMQRTAIQASPDMMTAITGRWTAGARRTLTDVHPFRKHLEELQIGDTIVGGPRVVSLDDIEHFAEFTGDTFYAHTDPAAAAENPLFGGIVAHGYLVVSLAAGLFVEPNPGPVLANFGVDGLRFLTPVKAGDALTVTLTAKQLTPRLSADYGEVRWDAVVTNQNEEPVATYDVLTLVAKKAD